MVSLRRLRFRRPLARRGCAALSLAAYLLVALGLPLPASARKANDQPFPCQDHPCGCQTAEECWRGCCCFTPAERWAWAREHHVEPPAYAEKPAAEGWCSTPAREQGKQEEAPACCGECCRVPRTPETVPAPPVPAKVRWSLGVTAQRCRGLNTLWVSTGVVLPVPASCSWKTCLPPVAWVVLPGSTGSTVGLPPADPPPRFLSA